MRVSLFNIDVYLHGTVYVYVCICTCVCVYVCVYVSMCSSPCICILTSLVHLLTDFFQK